MIEDSVQPINSLATDASGQPIPNSTVGDSAGGGVRGGSVTGLGADWGLR